MGQHTKAIVHFLHANKDRLQIPVLLQASDTPLASEQMARLSTDWYDAFLSFFIELDASPHLNSAELDDLLFFVKEDSQALDEPVFVKRHAGCQIPDIRQPIDWPSTFLLNLVCQAQFYLIVTVCGKRVMVDRRAVLVVKQQVIRRVFASHHETRVESRRRPDAIPPSSYPLIYFGIDDVEEAFSDFAVGVEQVLCVELVAAFDKTLPRAVPGNGLVDYDKDPGFAVLFQGAVPYEALRKASHAKGRRFLTGADPRTVLMRGPHGKGMSQVAIAQPRSILHSVFGRFRGGQDSADTIDGLHCGLVFVNLPWQSIVADFMAHRFCAPLDDDASRLETDGSSLGKSLVNQQRL